MLSSQDSLTIAIDCMDNGAFDYISKTQSSFIRINNMLNNIVGNIEINSTFSRVWKFILLIIFLVLIISFLINH